MSFKRHKHKGMAKFKGNTPPMQAEVTKDDKGVVLSVRWVDTVMKGMVYHPTKGWKKVREIHQHSLLNGLLNRIGLSLNVNQA